MSEIIRFADSIIRVEERFLRVYVSGTGHEAKFDNVPQGWFLTFASGWTLPIGPGKPEFKAGDSIRHTIEKV